MINYNTPSYYLDEQTLNNYVSKLAFNLTTHSLGAEMREKAKKAAQKVIVPTVDKLKKEVVGKAMGTSAACCLAPLGFDPYMVNATVKHLIMPNLAPALSANKIEDARKVYEAASSAMEMTGLMGLVKGNFFAWGAVCAEKLEENGSLNALKTNLKERALQHFDIAPYKSVNPNQVGLRAFGNLFFNIYLAAKRCFSSLKDAFNGSSSVNEAMHRSLLADGISLYQIREELDLPEILTQKYTHSFIPVLKMGLAATHATQSLYNKALSFFN